MARAKRKPSKATPTAVPTAQDDENLLLQKQILKQAHAEACLPMHASASTQRIIDNLVPWSDCQIREDPQ